MKLQILTPHKKDIHDITWLEVNTDVGNFVIQDGHAPTVLVLAPEEKIIFQVKGGGQESILIGSGVAAIEREQVTILISEQL